MRLALFTLLTIGILTYIYTYWLMKYILYFISIETQVFISIFVSILILFDNFNLVYDLNNIKPVGNPEHITIIGSQAIELQKKSNKLLDD